MKIIEKVRIKKKKGVLLIPYIVLFMKTFFITIDSIGFLKLKTFEFNDLTFKKVQSVARNSSVKTFYGNDYKQL